MTSETFDQLEHEATAKLRKVFASLNANRDQRAMFARYLSAAEKLFLDAAPSLAFTNELKAADDWEFLVKVITKSMEQNPLASKKDLLRLRGQLAFREQLEAAGGTYSTQQVADLLGIKSDAVRKRKAKGQLIAIASGEHTVYPTFQFDRSGVVRHLPELLEILKADSPVDAVQFFLTPDSDLGDTPINALKRGQNVELVFRLAKQFGRQVAR